MTKEQQFITEFRRIYNQATKAEYGSASISRVERQGLKKLLVRAKRELAESSEFTGNKNVDRKKIRSKVVEYLVQEGWPISVIVNAPDLAETAINHACVVAEFLITKRGMDSSADTVWSYSTKNQFDRFVQRIISQSNHSLLSEWHKPQNRNNKQNDKVKYPTKVQSEKIYGVGKAHRYWPAQLMKNLEAIRLGIMTQEELKSLGILDIDKSSTTIPWIYFKSIIESAESVEKITVDIAVQVIWFLKQKNVDEKQIVSIIINSYSPRGMISEHGDLPEIHQIWKMILEEIKDSNISSSIYIDLLGKVQARFIEAGSKL